jgi:hypothetical protein
MALSLKSLRKVTAIEPARIILYGTPKVGKTSLAAEFPDPVFLQVEEGTPGDLELTSFGQLTTFDAVLEAFTALIVEEHDYKTVVIDSLDAMEPLVWAETCRRNGWRSIEDPGYGRGYVQAEDTWRDLIAAVNALRSRGMTVVEIAHSEAIRYEPPGMEPYSRYHLKLHKRAAALVTQEADVIAFISYDVTLKKTDTGFGKKSTHAEGGGTRVIHLEERPSFAAGNRYGMPARLPYKKGQGYSVLAPYLPSAQAPEKPAPAPKRGSKATPETATSESE